MDFNQLKKTPLFSVLSKVGQSIYQPNGVFYWTDRARSEAEINGTIGSAVGPESDIVSSCPSKNITYYLPDLQKYITLHPNRMINYPPIAGVTEFRDQWAKWIVYKGLHAQNMPSGPRDISSFITKPVIFNGITHAIYITARLFLDPGEILLCPNKCWENYESVFTFQNGNPISYFEFFKDSRFNLAQMVHSMENIIQKQSKVVLIINFPNNPTGYCPTRAEAEEIVGALKEFCNKYKKPVVVLCDDAYEGYVYHPEVIQNSIFYEIINRHPLLIPIKLDGASKEMLMYGARISAITLGVHPAWISEADRPLFDKEWNNKLEAMVRSTISNTNRFAQEVLLELMKSGFPAIISQRDQIMRILKARFEKVQLAIKKYPHPELQVDPSGGGFFVFFNLKSLNAEKLADHLLKHHKVGLFPIYNPTEHVNGIRVAYCSIPENQIEECFKRITQAVRELSNS